MKPGKIVLIVLGSLAILFSLGALLSAGVVLYANDQRDTRGFFNTTFHRYYSSRFAITADRVDLGTDPGSPDVLITNNDIATIRVRVKSNRHNRRIFVGVGPTGAVNRYLKNVAHHQVQSVDLSPYTVTYKRIKGTAPKERPSVQSFWYTKAQGTGTVSILLPKDRKFASIVVMNSDGSRPVDVRIAVGAKVDFLLPLGLGILGFGVILLIGGIVMLVFGIRKPRGGPNTYSSGAGPGALQSGS